MLAARKADVRSPTTTYSSTACSRKRDRVANSALSATSLTYADYALMFRKDDPEFAEVVERAFHRLAGSREITAIGRAVVPKTAALGQWLNLPMSPHLEELFSRPGLPSD